LFAAPLELAPPLELEVVPLLELFPPPGPTPPPGPAPPELRHATQLGASSPPSPDCSFNAVKQPAQATEATTRENFQPRRPTPLIIAAWASQVNL
jgi:hypothetical protein